jgi:hypothetical protein
LLARGTSKKQTDARDNSATRGFAFTIHRHHTTFYRCALPRVSHLVIAQRLVVTPFFSFAPALISICKILQSQRQTTNRSRPICFDLETQGEILFLASPHNHAAARLLARDQSCTDAVESFSTSTTPEKQQRRQNIQTTSSSQSKMSTHFRPRPAAPPPTSPTRPSTSHSTIRAVTPSPPTSPQRRQSEPFSSPDLSKFRSYVLSAEANGGFSNTPVETGGEEVKLHGRGGGLASGRTSPAKASGRTSPSKNAISRRLIGGLALENRRARNSKASNSNSNSTSSEDEEAAHPSPPLTPTPMTREQKRSAYTPLGFHHPRASQPTQPSLPPMSPLTPFTPLTPGPRISPTDRVSISATSNITALSQATAASKHSVFSTPGRDELERKKALVEEDEGPFGRVKSMVDLEGERRRVRSGKVGEGELKKERGCGLERCVVM